MVRIKKHNLTHSYYKGLHFFFSYQHWILQRSSTSKRSHFTFYTSSSDLSAWRGSPWSHPGWWGPPEVLPDARTLSDCGQRETINTRHQVEVKNHMKRTWITWKCTPVDSMIFVALLRRTKKNIKLETLQSLNHPHNMRMFYISHLLLLYKAASWWTMLTTTSKQRDTKQDSSCNIQPNKTTVIYIYNQ